MGDARMIGSRSAVGDRERGAVLAFVVLILLALMLLVHGTLVESLSELSASRAAVRELRARTATRTGVQRAMDAGGGQWMDSVALWGIRVVDTFRLGSLSTTTTLRRLGVETWLVEGATRVGAVEVVRSARLAWSFDPLTRVAALEGAVSVGGSAPVVVQGAIDVVSPTSILPPPELDACDPWLGALVARYATAPLAPVATLAAGTGAPALGLLDFASVLSAASSTVAGVGTPQPVEAGGSCVISAPWNWGDPVHPWRACGELLVLVGSTGDLRVDGGSGQGMLVIDGDLTLSGGAHLRGFVLTSGVLRVESGSLLEGLAVASGGLEVAGTATVRASACWAARALAAQRDALARLVPLPETGWIGPL